MRPKVVSTSAEEQRSAWQSLDPIKQNLRVKGEGKIRCKQTNVKNPIEDIVTEYNKHDI